MRFEKIFASRLILMFLIIPYIYPIGLDGIPVLKQIFIVWGIVSMVCTIVLYMFNWRGTPFILCMLLYHVTLILITILGDAGITDGLKKMFMFPCACLLCDMWMRKKTHILLKTVMDIMFIEQALNLILWNVKSFGETNFLLGIRTDFSIVGFLAIFTALMCINLKLPATRYRAYLTIAMVVISVFRAWVSTGIAVFTVFAVLFIFITRKKFAKPITEKLFSSIILIPAGVFINIAVVFFSWQDKFEKYITQYLGETMTLNGRTFIWEQAIKAFHDSPVWGYGAYGCYVETFWTKFNYVHNQMLQLLLDGGVILAIIFLICLITIGMSIEKCRDSYIKQVAVAVLFSNLLIMIVEAPAAYSVFFILIAIMVNTDQLVMLKEQRKAHYDRVAELGNPGIDSNVSGAVTKIKRIMKG